MIVLSLCMFTPLLVPLWFSRSFFDLFVEPRVAIMATRYVKIVSVGGIINVVGSSFQFFSTGQGKPRYILLSTLTASTVHFIIAKILVDQGYALTGCAIASSIQFVVRTCIWVLVATCDKDLNKSLVSIKDPRVWDKEGFRELNHQGWSSFLLKVMGWWAFDVFTLLAGQLTTSDTAAQTIMRNVGLYTFMIPVGFSTASNFLVGKYIGKNRVDLAKQIEKQCNLCGYAWSVASMSLIWFCRQSIYDFYTNDRIV